MPLFSVLIPAYNVEKYIRNCLESVIKQTFKDFEVIVVNDGSTDKSEDIISEFVGRDNRFRYFNQNNSGVVATRKLAINNAIGNYAVVVDGDDYISENYLLNFANIIKTHKPDIVITGLTQNYVKGKKKILSGFNSGFYSREKMEKEIFSKLMEDKNGKYLSPTLWAKCFKLELYKKWQLNVDNNIKMGDDAVCIIPAIAEANSVYIDNLTDYFYNYNPTSITHFKKTYSVEDPILRAEILSKSVDLTKFDFKQQFYRTVLRQSFAVACSLFNQNLSNKEIKEQVRNFLNYNNISESITNAHYSFKYIKGNLMKLILKRNIFLAMRAYSKIKF